MLEFVGAVDAGGVADMMVMGSRWSTLPAYFHKSVAITVENVAADHKQASSSDDNKISCKQSM